MIPSLPLFKRDIITSDAAVTTAASHRVMKAILAAAAGAAATLELNDSDDNSGTDRVAITAAAGTVQQWDEAELGGVLFANGIYADIGGAGAVAYVIWD